MTAAPAGGRWRDLHSTVPWAVPLDVGRCADFGAVISAGCDHLMQVDGSSCRCPGCGTVCRGKFSGCPEVWAGGSGPAKAVALLPKPPAPDPAPRPAPPGMPLARSEAWLKALQSSPPIVAAAPPLRTPPVPLTPAAPPIAFARAPSAPTAPAPAPAPPTPAAPAAPAATAPPAPPAPPASSPAAVSAPPPAAAERIATEPVRQKRPPKPKEAPPAAQADVTAMLEILEQSYERLSADLAERARGLDERAREIDDRAAAHLQALDYDRATLPEELRRTIARAVPEAVDTAVRQAVDTRVAGVVQALEHDRASVPSELRQTLALSMPGAVADAVHQSLPSMVADAVEEALPGMVADVVAEVLEAQAPRLQPQEPAPPPRAAPDPLVSARQRSLEKRLDGLTRRAQEIDDRVSTHLRGIDEDRRILSDVVRHQDRLAQSVAGIDVAGHTDRLSKWVNDSVPTMVAAAVQTALDAQSAAFTTALGRTERARADTQALSASIQATSERILEALYRRDQQIDDRATILLAALEQERMAVAELLENNREQVQQSVLAGLPVLVNSAVRVAMDAYRSERRSGVEELAARIRADSDVMRETLQRSFEKMMEALANREQELDERAAAHRRALEREKGEMSELWAKAARSLTDALPGMVAEAVRTAGELDRLELDSIREETGRLREQSEAAASELRVAIQEVREALGSRDEAIERQAAAYERAVDAMRNAMSRPAASPSVSPSPTPPSPPSSAPSPSPTPSSAAPAPEIVPTAVVNLSDDGRVLYGRSNIPRAQRVERRMLKIDDSNAAWPALSRREAALSDLLDSDDQ